MREHGIDPQAQHNANKIVYDIPPLEYTLKPTRTPVMQILRDVKDGVKGAARDAIEGMTDTKAQNQWKGKLTV